MLPVTASAQGPSRRNQQNIRIKNVQSFRCKVLPLRPWERPQRSISRTFYANVPALCPLFTAARPVARRGSCDAAQHTMSDSAVLLRLNFLSNFSSQGPVRHAWIWNKPSRRHTAAGQSSESSPFWNGLICWENRVKCSTLSEGSLSQQ